MEEWRREGTDGLLALGDFGRPSMVNSFWMESEMSGNTNRSFSLSSQYLFNVQAENTGRLTTDYNDPTVVGVSFYSQYGQHDDRSDAHG
jgi:hypothetical protein